MCQTFKLFLNISKLRKYKALQLSYFRTLIFGRGDNHDTQHDIRHYCKKMRHLSNVIERYQTTLVNGMLSVVMLNVVVPRECMFALSVYML
jgi:hypothetical protein